MAETETAVNEFDTDTHRRVCANLAQPRSLQDLAAFLRATDPYVDDAAYTVDGVVDYVRDLEADGLVKKLGTFDSGDELVKAIKNDGDVVTLHKDKAAALVQRFERPDIFPHDDEDQYVLTQLALDRINGPIPNEPSLEGAALAAAEQDQAAWFEENERIAKEAEK